MSDSVIRYVVLFSKEYVKCEGAYANFHFANKGFKCTETGSRRVAFHSFSLFLPQSLYQPPAHICMIQNIGFAFTDVSVPLIHMRGPTLKNILFCN